MFANSRGRLVICLLVVSKLVNQAFGWGSDGHRVITKIAVELTGDRGYLFATNLIDEDLPESSVWADTAPSVSKYPGSDQYHFSHTPYRSCDAFDFKRDCGFGRSGLCLVSGLSRFIGIAVDPYRSREERQDALKFILHLMGDIHQPLHTGFREDAGGTLINVTTPAELSLHEVFDFDIIARYKAAFTPPHWEMIAAKAIKLFRASPQIKATYRLTSDLDAYVTSDESSTQFASMLASETSITTTCRFGYTDETGSYIENDAVLTPAYYKSRVAGVVTLLAKAGLRLAALLDALSTEYSRRKAEKEAIEYDERIAAAVARLLEPVVTPEPVTRDSNRFASLAIFFDPEAIVEDTDDVEDVGRVSPETLPSTPSKRLKINSSKPKVSSADRTIFEGVDLAFLALIRRRGLYFVTDKRLVLSHKYMPFSFSELRFQLVNNTADVAFRFDHSVFPGNMSDELAVRSVLKLNGIKLGVEESISQYIVGGNLSTSVERVSQLEFAKAKNAEQVRSGFIVVVSEQDPEARKSKIESVTSINAILKARHAERQEFLQAEFREKFAHIYSGLSSLMEARAREVRSQVVVVTHDRLKIFVLIETLKQPRGERLRFNYMPVQTMAKSDGGHKAGILIDQRFFDGTLTHGLQEILQSVSKSNKALSRKHIKTRPTFADEIVDINMMFYGTDPDRMERRKVVAEFMVYPGDDLSRYLVFEWGIEHTLSNLTAAI